MTPTALPGTNSARETARLAQLARVIASHCASPLQFVGDNARFLAEASSEVGRLLSWYQASLRILAKGRHERLVDEVAALEERVDLPHLLKEMPVAALQSLQGIAEVTAAMRALRAIIDAAEAPQSVDVVDSLRVALEATRGAWTTYATVTEDIEADLPRAWCPPSVLLGALVDLLLASSACRGPGPVTLEASAVSGGATLRLELAFSLAAPGEAVAATDVASLRQALATGGMGFEAAASGSSWRAVLSLPRVGGREGTA